MARSMQAVIQAVNRTDLRGASPAQCVEHCARAWAAARLALLQSRGPAAWPSDPGATRTLFEGLCRWRGAAPQGLSPPVQQARYLVQCAVRLLLLNELQRMPRAEAEALRLGLAGWSAPLLDSELRELCEFHPLEGRAAASQAVGRASAAWHAGPPPSGLPAQCAFALLFTRDAETGVPTALLRDCAVLDAAEAARSALLRAMRLRASPGCPPNWPPQEDLSAAVRDWARQRAGGSFGEEASRRFSEALVEGRLGPLDAPLPGEEPSATLARGDPGRASEVMARAKRGVRLLAGQEADEEEEDSLTLCMLAYYMEQIHHVPWAQHFLCSHLSPEAARLKVERYMADRMVSPPPLVLRGPAGTFLLLERSPRPGALAAVWLADRAAGAIGHWLHWVRVHRGGTVAAGRSVARLVGEILEPPAGTAGGSLCLGLESV